MYQTVSILGVNVASDDPSNIVALLDDRIARKEPTRVAFLNAHLSNVVEDVSEVREALSAFLVLNDGAGVDLARRVLHGEAFSHNLNGTDLVPYYLAQSRHHLRLYLLGGHADIVASATRVINKRWPHHEVVGAHDGYFTPSEDRGVRENIARARPDVVLVGMGNPRQEAWIARNVPSACPCALGVGAWFDFITGAVPRAPPLVRKARLEWLFRLAVEPRRLWRRYIVGNTRFVARLMAAKAFGK